MASSSQSSGERPIWLSEAVRCKSAGDLEGALDIIYSIIDEMLIDREYDACDSLFKTLAPEFLGIDLSIGILTITFAARRKLPSRNLFFEKATRYADEIGQNEDGLFNGLN